MNNCQSKNCYQPINGSGCCALHDCAIPTLEARIAELVRQIDEQEDKRSNLAALDYPRHTGCTMLIYIYKRDLRKAREKLVEAKSLLNPFKGQRSGDK